mmetsp:Transcript_44370/g.110384  ORF Transcript_44370/g.110384 Transcript_44370/m.110384 type:complete len:277 (-) Transcript_44370:221-1051(-)
MPDDHHILSLLAVLRLRALCHRKRRLRRGVEAVRVLALVREQAIPLHRRRPRRGLRVLQSGGSGEELAAEDALRVHAGRALGADGAEGAVLLVALEAVHERDALRHLHRREVGHRQVLNRPHQRAQGVAMPHDEHRAAFLEVGHDVVVPHGLAARHHLAHRLALGHGDRLPLEPLVPPVILRVVAVLLAVGRQLAVEGAPPRLELRLAVLLEQLVRRAPRQPAVRAFVQPPRLAHLHVRLVERAEQQPRGVDRALEHGRVRHVERVPRLQQRRRRG